MTGKRRITHGMYGTDENKAWNRMKTRCYNPNYDGYQRYGGRGIKVCERWRDSFENFYKDMGPRPSPNHSIERINNNDDYTPENCIWATMKEQSRNRRSNVTLEFDGRSMCLTDWAREININRQTLYARIYRGWSIEQALTEPVDK